MSQGTRLPFRSFWQVAMDSMSASERILCRIIVQIVQHRNTWSYLDVSPLLPVPHVDLCDVSGPGRVFLKETSRNVLILPQNQEARNQGRDVLVHNCEN